MRKFIKPNAIVLDVGENIGYHTKLMATLAGAGKVLAFEPNPALIPMISYNCRNLPISVLNYALGKESAAADLHVSAEYTFLGSLSKTFTRKWNFWSKESFVGEHSVSIRNGDEALKENGVTTVDFVKIDVEGWEVDAFTGLRQTLASSPRIVILF